MSGSEHLEQVALMNLARIYEGRYPELELLHAVPNGGLRNKKVAKDLKAEGVKAGVPDLDLPVARGGYHGLRIEMKYGKNKPTDSQEEWMRALTKQGHKCLVCYSAESAWREIITYLET